MNNQQTAGDQMLQLQNIAYVKQFMQKASVKVLFLVTLLTAIANSIFIYLFKDIYYVLFNFLFSFLSGLGGETVNPEDFESLSDIINIFFNGMTVITAVVGLILPITLLYIIIRSRSDNPSVIPSGAVKFLYVLSFIQTIVVVASAVMSIIAQFFAIFGADDTASAVVSFISTIISLFISCLYYILQTKFLGAIKHSCTGYSLIYGQSNGFGIYSVLSAIGSGLLSACSIVIVIVFYSLLNSASLEKNTDFDYFLALGGNELFDTIKPVVIVYIAITVLNTLYHILMATIAFSYKDFVTLAVRESFSLHKRPNINNSSAFRTYGGSNSYSNYNYTSSGARGQQSYAAAANATNNNAVNNNGISEAPVDSNYNPYSNQQNTNNTPQYNESVIGNGSFTPVQQQFENNINKEPVTTSGSFGFQQDSNNN